MMELLKKYMELGMLIEPGLEGKLTEDLFEKIKLLQKRPVVLTKEFLETLASVEIKIFTKEQKKEYDIKDVVNFYAEKYETLRSCLMRRVELKNIVSINNVGSNLSESATLIGMVKELAEKHIEIEDMTESIKVMLPEEKIRALAADDVIAVHGTARNKLFFATAVYQPDVPLRETKTTNIKIAFLFGSQQPQQMQPQLQQDADYCFFITESQPKQSNGCNISIASLPLYIEIKKKETVLLLLTKNIDMLTAIKKRYFKMETTQTAFPPEFIIEQVPDIILNYCCPQQPVQTQNYKGITIISASQNVLIDLESREVKTI